MITNEYLERLNEQVRLAYAHLLNLHIQYCKIYSEFIFMLNDEELEKDFHIIDQFFCNKSGKINWETIRILMPPDIEEKIQNKYKILNINEIKLCCLILFNVRTTDITDILSYQKGSIHTITNRIRQKIGVKNIKGSLKRLILSDEDYVQASRESIVDNDEKISGQCCTKRNRM